jgi:hypothetical protein
MDRNNYEVRDDGVYCCFNLHEKGLPCEYEKLSNEEIEGLLQEYRKEIYAKQAEIALLKAQLNAYEKNGVTCQTYRHFVDIPCAECNSRPKD